MHAPEWKRLSLGGCEQEYNHKNLEDVYRCSHPSCVNYNDCWSLRQRWNAAIRHHIIPVLQYRQLLDGENRVQSSVQYKYRVKSADTNTITYTWSVVSRASMRACWGWKQDGHGPEKCRPPCLRDGWWNELYAIERHSPTVSWSIASSRNQNSQRPMRI